MKTHVSSRDVTPKFEGVDFVAVGPEGDCFGDVEEGSWRGSLGLVIGDIREVKGNVGDVA